jgi:MFS family permease
MDGRWLALILLTAARVSMGFQFQSLASVAPLLVDELGVAYVDIGFLVGLYMLPGIVLALPGGLLGQRFGDTRLVMVGLALMVAGGVVMALAPGSAALAAGRLVSGLGAVLLNVLMSKMITDWFAGREIVLAMSIFVNSFPIGIGLALLTLGWLAEGAGWPAAFHATAAAASAALLLMALAYRPHPAERPGQTAAGAQRISGREVALVCLAGMIWGLYNGAFTITFSFTPILLVDLGLTVGRAGFLVGLATWLTVASIQAGGIIAQRRGRPNELLLAGLVVWGLCLLLLPRVDPLPVLVVLGLFMGLPVGVIMSLPAAVLRPASRGTGMGIFFTWLYVGHAALPPVAGWLQDVSGSPAAPLYFAAVLVLATVTVFALFRLLQQRLVQPAAAQPVD